VVSLEKLVVGVSRREIAATPYGEPRIPKNLFADGRSDSSGDHQYAQPQRRDLKYALSLSEFFAVTTYLHSSQVFLLLL